jgi:hypothetical protein
MNKKLKHTKYPQNNSKFLAKNMTTYPTYHEYLNDWDENDKKAEECIKTHTHDRVIKSFYRELNFTKGELPSVINAVTIHPCESKCKIYPKHNPNILTMCKEVEDFIQSKGFPYKLNQAESGFNHSGIWPMRCRFQLKK